MTRRLLPSRAAIRALAGSDGLLFSGGGLIHDHWPSVIPRYLAWIILARLLGKRVVWLGVGVGPLRRRASRLLARVAARLTTLALVRDDASARLLGGPGLHVQVVPDAALFNPAPDQAGRSPGDELPIIVRGPAPSDAARAGWLADRLVALALAARDRGWRPVLLTMGGGADDSIVAAMRRRLPPSTAIMIDALGATPAASVDRLGQCRAAVSVRLHGMLLAAVAGVPTVAIAYDPKVRSAADGLGLGDLVVDLDRFEPSDVLERVDRALEPARRTALLATIDALRCRRADVARLVERACGVAA